MTASRLSKLHARDVDGDGDRRGVAAGVRGLCDGSAHAMNRFGDFVIRAGIVARTVAGLDFHENLAPALRN